MVSSGLRVGASALATRGLQADDFTEIGRIIATALQPGFDAAKAELAERVDGDRRPLPALRAPGRARRASERARRRAPPLARRAPPRALRSSRRT